MKISKLQKNPLKCSSSIETPPKALVVATQLLKPHLNQMKQFQNIKKLIKIE